MADAKQMLRQVMGQFATGVTIVSLVNERGEPTGLTANALTSVSLDPPLILICVDKKSQSYPHFKQGAHFSVSVLSEKQEELSRRFARTDSEKFEGVPHHLGTTGAPIVDDALAYIECEVVDSFPGGDHTIFLGEVKESGMTEGLPLLFFRGAYRRLDPQ
jgi:flavin reductase (DIM6/NTAB) family NADH-FMN oxidoreductase RutF